MKVLASDATPADRGARRLARLSISAATVFLLAYLLQTAVFSPSGFLQTLRPLSTSPALQHSVQAQLEQVVTQAAPTIPGPLVRTAAEQVTRSPAFATIWLTTEASVHAQILAAVRGPATNGPLPLSIDLSSLVSLVIQQLALDGVAVREIPTASSSLQLTTLPASEVATIRTMDNVVGGAEAGAAVVAVVAALAALVTARRRVRIVEVLGSGVALQSAILLGILGVALGRVDSIFSATTDAGRLSTVLYQSLTSQFVDLLQLVGGAALAVGVTTLVGEGMMRALGSSRTIALSAREVARVVRLGAVLVGSAVIVAIGSPTQPLVMAVFVPVIAVALGATSLGYVVDRQRTRNAIVIAPALQTNSATMGV